MTVVALAAVGIVLGARWLLRRAGVVRPLTVALLGLLAAVSVFGLGSIAALQILASRTEALGPVLLLAAGWLGFVIVSRIAHHRTGLLATALACTAVSATTWWLW